MILEKSSSHVDLNLDADEISAEKFEATENQKNYNRSNIDFEIP